MIKSPFFSVILAFRNEEAFLKTCLESFDNQVLGREKWEIILVDGNSTDNSKSIAEDYAREHANALLLSNPEMIATSGWNKGLEVARGKYYHIANAHSVTDELFLDRAEKILTENPDIQALGGRIFKYGEDKLSNSISEATNVPFAMGGSYYRVGTKPKKVNVIGQGIYLKDLIERLGPYDTNLGRSGDWEFNYRICSSGYNMYFDPRLVVRVLTRADYSSIFKQQFRTGFWKVRIWAKHRKSLLPRHIVPAFFVLYLILLSFFYFMDGSLFTFLLIPLIIYVMGALMSTLKALNKSTRWYFILPAFPVIHIAYGLGFITGIFRWFKYFFIGQKKESNIHEQL